MPEKKIIKVDAETCIGCGACVSHEVAGKYFKLNDEGKSQPVAGGEFDESDLEAVNEVIAGCPVQAISIE